VSDQGLQYLSLMSIYSEYFRHSQCSVNHEYYLKQVKTTDLG